MQQPDKKAIRLGAIIYTGTSAVLMLIFLVATLFFGETYTRVDRIRGMVWVFILAMIVLMPIVIPKVKARYRQ